VICVYARDWSGIDGTVATMYYLFISLIRIQVQINGVKTLRTQDTSESRHFGTIRLVLKCLDSSASVLTTSDLVKK